MSTVQEGKAEDDDRVNYIVSHQIGLAELQGCHQRHRRVDSEPPGPPICKVHLIRMCVVSPRIPRDNADAPALMSVTSEVAGTLEVAMGSRPETPPTRGTGV